MRAATLLLLLASCGRSPGVLARIPEGTELEMPPAFTPDGRHVAYIARTGKDCRVVRGEWTSRRLDAI